MKVKSINSSRESVPTSSSKSQFVSASVAFCESRATHYEANTLTQSDTNFAHEILVCKESKRALQIDFVS